MQHKSGFYHLFNAAFVGYTSVQPYWKQHEYVLMIRKVDSYNIDRKTTMF